MVRPASNKRLVASCRRLVEVQIDDLELHSSLSAGLPHGHAAVTPRLETSGNQWNKAAIRGHKIQLLTPLCSNRNHENSIA